ncbi:MAG TPA: hypothetical protein VI298_06755 [Geobacteraceae bacterium]
MKEEEKQQLLRHFHIREVWVIFFILGIIMMNYPFIHIFHKPRILVFGMPVLFLYLYLGWLVSIIVIYLFVKATDLAGEKNKGERR